MIDLPVYCSGVFPSIGVFFSQCWVPVGSQWAENQDLGYLGLHSLKRQSKGTFVGCNPRILVFSTSCQQLPEWVPEPAD